MLVIYESKATTSTVHIVASGTVSRMSRAVAASFNFILAFVTLIFIRVEMVTARAQPMTDPKGASVLVTGAAGFIGSHVAQACAEKGMKVVAMDDMSGGFESNIPKGITFINGDCRDALLLEKLFKEHKFAYVYHLAAYAAEGLSHFVRSYNYRVRVLFLIVTLSCFFFIFV